MAGSISLSVSQQFDQFGAPLSGGKLNFYQAGTVAAPQNAFQDYGLTIPWPNPITLDATGRVPQFYLADGFIKIVLTDKNGAEQVTADNLLVVGPSSGGGGGGGVDPTTVLQTGWLQPIYGAGVVNGFVRLNGRTIGTVTSGATERANADTQALFIFLYTQDAGLAVSGGRGANAAADFAANKTIALPDGRGKAIAALADMGNTNNGIYSAVTFSRGDSVTLGSIVGAARRQLLLQNLPAYTPAGSLSLSTPVSTSVTTTGTASVTSTVSNIGQGTNTGDVSLQTGAAAVLSGFANGTRVNSAITSTGNITASSPATSTATPTGTFTGSPQGGSAAFFDTVSPYLLITLYIKL